MFKIDRSQHLCINPDEREKHKAKKNKFHQLGSFLENGKYQFIVHKNKKNPENNFRISYYLFDDVITFYTSFMKTFSSIFSTFTKLFLVKVLEALSHFFPESLLFSFTSAKENGSS